MQPTQRRLGLKGMELVLCSFLTLLFILLVNIIPKYRLKWRVQALGLPQLKEQPIVGNFFQVVKLFNLSKGVPFSAYLMEQIKGYIHLSNTKGLVFGSAGPTYYLAVTDADAVETLLTDHHEVNKSKEYVFSEDWLGTGLITSSYQKWKVHRKLLTPTFHFRILDQFQPIMDSQADVLVNKLRDEIGKPFVSIKPLVANCALDIIAETALGIKIYAQKNGSSSFVNSLERIETLIFKRICSPWLWPNWMFQLSPTGIQFYKSLLVVKEFVRKVITARKSQIEKESSGSDIVDESCDRKRRLAFLDLLLMNSSGLSQSDVEAEVHTFAFAGHDTTTSGMSWTLYLLGLYPEVQAKVHEELDQVFGRDNLKDRTVTLEHLKNLPYLERVIKETMRLYPPVPLIARLLRSDFTINGTTIPGGSTVVIPVPVVHRDPKYFPNPEVFDPDRFLDVNRHPFAYIPFSAGPRNCIGQRYAMLEMKTVLCKILLNFKLTSLDARDLVLLASEVVSKPSRPIRIEIQKR